MTDRKAVRRVVTGHDDAGRAVILSDGAAPNDWSSDAVPGFGATVPWWTPDGVIDHVTDADPASADVRVASFPGPGETIMRIADFPPDSAYPERAADVVFSDIDGHAERAAAAGESDDRHFWFHRTDSLDYAIVLEGEITLLVDAGEATLGPGDVVIQRATNHSWSNRTDRSSRMLFVLIGTPPLSPEQIAVQRTARTTSAEIR